MGVGASFVIYPKFALVLLVLDFTKLNQYYNSHIYVGRLQDIFKTLPVVGKKSEEAFSVRAKVNWAIEDFSRNSPRYIQHLTYLTQMLDFITKALNKTSWTFEEISAECETCDVPPFWYSYESGLDRLQQILETVKYAVSETAKSNPERVGKNSPLGYLALSGAKAIIHRARDEDIAKSLKVVHKEADIQVLKMMWCLPDDEYLSTFASLSFPSIEVSIRVMIPRDESLGGSIPCQFISAKPLDFQIPSSAILGKKKSDRDSFPANTNPTKIFLHFHGGGFVSGSPHIHETYLRDWAKSADCLIVSVDYTLAPSKLWPHQVEECFYVYNWLVDQNPWGINPSEIILGGDSAGGNLAAVTMMKILQENTTIRHPDGLLLAYPALNLTSTVSPSRVMFVNDVVVPFYFLDICLKNYIPPVQILKQPYKHTQTRKNPSAQFYPT
eukprot:TRINITY_DN8797_c0_g1_i9.p1 TRINITY_DN8797_c0_g1~~TRINITY_DN8797_c0_g1_i9.p1  ORF type:complete len:441 (+),score=66.59 TRINITY_DN8797_c0_g1_i9:420-1742(+)